MVIDQRVLSKANGLVRVAEKYRGDPIGMAARRQLLSLIQAHPDLKLYKPVDDLIWRDIMFGGDGKNIRGMGRGIEDIKQ